MFSLTTLRHLHFLALYLVQNTITLLYAGKKGTKTPTYALNGLQTETDNVFKGFRSVTNNSLWQSLTGSLYCYTDSCHSGVQRIYWTTNMFSQILNTSASSLVLVGCHFPAKAKTDTFKL